MKIFRRVTVLLFFLLVQNAAAQESETPEETSTTDQETPVTTTTTEPTDESDAGNDIAAEGEEQKPKESFVPTEDISEDLSVSFPVDI